MIQLDMYDRNLSQNTVAKLLYQDGFTVVQIRDFFNWKQKNPHVYKEFERQFLKRVNDGFTPIGAKDIWEDMRKMKELKTKDELYNLDNRQTSMCIAVMSYKWHEYAHLVERRKKRAA